MHTDREKRITELEALLPFYTEHLNRIQLSFTQLDGIKKFFDNHDQIVQYVDFSKYRKQLELAGFLSISTLDMIVSSKNLLGAREIWEEIYYLRHGYLTIYETLKIVDAYTQWLKESAKNNDLLEEFAGMVSNLRKFKVEYDYQKYLPHLRNKVIAHIDQDFSVYFGLISVFDIDKGIKALIDFIQIVNVVQKYLSSIGRADLIRIKKIERELDIRLVRQINEIRDHFNFLQENLNNGLKGKQ